MALNKGSVLALYPLFLSFSFVKKDEKSSIFYTWTYNNRKLSAKI